MTTRSDGGQPPFQPSMTCRQTMAASCRCLAWSCSLTAWRERPRAAMNKQAPRSRPARPSARKKKPLASGDTDAPGLRRHDDRTRIGPIGRSNDHSHRMLRTAIDSKAYISFRYLQARRIGPFLCQPQGRNSCRGGLYFSRGNQRSRRSTCRYCW